MFLNTLGVEEFLDSTKGNVVAKAKSVTGSLGPG